MLPCWSRGRRRCRCTIIIIGEVVRSVLCVSWMAVFLFCVDFGMSWCLEVVGPSQKVVIRCLMRIGMISQFA